MPADCEWDVSAKPICDYITRCTQDATCDMPYSSVNIFLTCRRSMLHVQCMLPMADKKRILVFTALVNLS